MKKIKTHLFKKAIICLGISITALACKKSPGTDPSPAAASGTFNYKVDGTLSTADSAYAILYGPKTSRAMDIYSRKGKYEGMEFHFSPVTGTQPVGTLTGGGVLLTFYDTNNIEYDSVSGAFNLTTCDTSKKIEGSFSFAGKMQSPGTGTKNITEGHILITKIYHQ